MEEKSKCAERAQQHEANDSRNRWEDVEVHREDATYKVGLLQKERVLSGNEVKVHWISATWYEEDDSK
jgi:hypothetical protein